MLKPVFSSEGVAGLDHTSKLSLALDGTKYLPGIVGLNNIKVSSYSEITCDCLLKCHTFSV